MFPEGLRRSSRIPKEIPILLVGSDIDGKVFSEQTSTVVLSRHGAGIVSEYKLSAEQELTVCRLDTNQEAEVRVVGQLGSETDIYTYGVAFLDPSIDFWGVEFPPLTESEKQANRLLLECSSCRGREMVEQSDPEADVYRVNEQIVRYCKKCGSSTVWKEPRGAIEQEPVSQQAQQQQDVLGPPPAPTTPTPAEKPQASSADRRKHHRTRVSYKACVRGSGFEEEIATCEDMSRGGLCFKSRKRYFRGSLIDVAVPYEPDTASIFVPAQVVYVLELTEEKLFRCGAAYLKGSRTL
jgi:ribosomal protein L33